MDSAELLVFLDDHLAGTPSRPTFRHFGFAYDKSYARRPKH